MQSWGRTWAGQAQGCFPQGKKQFYGVFCSGIARSEVSQQANTLILGRRKDRGGFFWCFLNQEKVVATPALTSPGCGCFTRMETKLSWVLLALKVYFTGPNLLPALFLWLPSGMGKAGHQEGTWSTPGMLLPRCYNHTPKENKPSCKPERDSITGLMPCPAASN